MTIQDEMARRAADLESAADMLDSALLAPSMKAATLRREATELRELANYNDDRIASAEAAADEGGPHGYAN